MKDAATAAGALRSAAGLVFLGLLVWAPLNYGSTRAGGPEVLTAGCAAGTFLCTAAWALGRFRPQVPALAAGAAACFVVAVLPWSLGLYHPTPVSPFTQAHFNQVSARWPHSIVWRDRVNAGPLAVALVAALLALTDLARARGWLLAFSIALVGTAALEAALALAQSATAAPGIFWRNEGRLPGNFSGTFYHHTSAGAYFNTAWPLAVALTCLAWDRARSAPARATAAGLAGLAALLVLAGHASHVSRFPQIAALLVAPFLLGGLGLLRRWRRRSVAVVAGSAVLLGGLIFATGRTGEIITRWQLVFAPEPAAAAVELPAPSQWPTLMRADLFVPFTGSPGLFGVRREAWRTALRSIADRPFTGHGPANWIGAASQHSSDPLVRTFYQFLQFAHQDTLQAAVEWGVAAALAWWALLIGGVVAVGRNRTVTDRTRRALGLAAGCGLAAVLLQAQLDFPLQIPAVAFNAVVLAAIAWTGAPPPSHASVGLPAQSHEQA